MGAKFRLNEWAPAALAFFVSLRTGTFRLLPGAVCAGARQGDLPGNQGQDQTNDFASIISSLN